MEQAISILVAAVILVVAKLIRTFSKNDAAQKAASQQNHELEVQLREVQEKLVVAQQQLVVAQQQLVVAQRMAKKYTEVKQKLELSSVIHEYFQPVILVGPRAVGKTSLLAQWHAPWDHNMLPSTRSHQISIVPLYDFKLEKKEPHFADPEIMTTISVNLKLRVHDFPGELGQQRNIVAQTKQETQELRRSTGKDLGIVLICMFDAQEVVKGVSDETNKYYNGELFRNLREVVAHDQVGIERLILVFNKYDLLMRHFAQKDEDALLQTCLTAYKPIISLLRGTCNSQRVCEVCTILDRANITRNNRGAPIVMGEAARGFVEAMVGVQEAQYHIKDRASNYAAPLFY